jgi:hypothetical protein
MRSQRAWFGGGHQRELPPARQLERVNLGAAERFVPPRLAWARRRRGSSSGRNSTSRAPPPCGMSVETPKTRFPAVARSAPGRQEHALADEVATSVSRPVVELGESLLDAARADRRFRRPSRKPRLSCVTRTAVAPDALRMSPSATAARAGGVEVGGGSSSSRFGRGAARARATRCCWPPEARADTCRAHQ